MVNGWKNKAHHRKPYIIAQYQIWICFIHWNSSRELWLWMCECVNVNQNSTIFPYGSNFFNWKTNKNVSFISVPDREGKLSSLTFVCYFLVPYCSILVHCTHMKWNLFVHSFIFWFMPVHPIEFWVQKTNSYSHFEYFFSFFSLVNLVIIILSLVVPIVGLLLILHIFQCEPSGPYSNIGSQLNRGAIQVRGTTKRMNTVSTARKHTNFGFLNPESRQKV